MIRLPFAPLEDWFALHYPPPDAVTHERERNNGRPDALRMADTFGVNEQTIQNWRRTGLLVYTADKVACSVGRHPVYFWPDWYEVPIQEKHGGPGGYSVHQRHGTEPCTACREAINIVQRGNKARRAGIERRRRLKAVS